jgi:DnaJ-class molecular chaperone
MQINPKVIREQVIQEQIGLRPGECPKCLGTGFWVVPENLWKQEGCSGKECPSCDGSGKENS